MADAGMEIVRIAGGYKAFRQYLMCELDQMAVTLQTQAIKPIVLAGRTGAGKTQVLNQFKFALDLEGLAQHRGSTFGGHAWPQPSQIDFEHQLAYRWIELQHQGYACALFEDEGRNIGSVHLSAELFNAIKSGERIFLDTPFIERRQNILQEYVVEAQAEYPSLEAWHDWMLKRFVQIAKRLGGVGYAKLQTAFNQAWLDQRDNGGLDAHLVWIDQLLTDYYDPMYDYQLKRYPQAFKIAGDRQTIQAYLAQF
jgi:tRNA 2-selenouridine synthase